MIVTGSQLRQIGWVAVLAACAALFAVLSFRVHAVKSEVRLAERQIVALERETLILETEFQTRASQRQLADWNAVEFGYEAPRADQYFENERQLASLGLPAGPGAPSPIRVARLNLVGAGAPARAMVSPLTGEPVTLASVDAQADAGAVFTEAFGDFLIEASPIRAANAQTPLSSGPGAAARAARSAEKFE
jgi:hypothetical protein